MDRENSRMQKDDNDEGIDEDAPADGAINEVPTYEQALAQIAALKK
jgi:hypothetical protein